MEVTRLDPNLSVQQFAEVVRDHQSMVLAAAYGVTGDRALAEDVAQETFVAAWRTRSTLRDPSKLRPWLRGIARNLAHKAQRKSGRGVELEDAASADDLTSDVVAKDEARVTWAALDQLPETYREVLVLYYWEEMSAKQVADAIGITEANAMQRLSRGRALLREEIVRKVEGTLRRARPGAALTAAIVAAIAASAAGSASAASLSTASSPGGQALATVTRPLRRSWPLASLLAILVVVCVVGGWLTVSAAGKSTATQESSRTPVVAAANRTNATTTQPTKPTSATPASPTAAAAAAGQDPTDDVDPAGEFMTVDITSDGKRPDWVSREPYRALSACFSSELIGHPATIELDVRAGKIESAKVTPTGLTARRVPLRNVREGLVAPVAPAELRGWLAAGNELQTTPYQPGMPPEYQAVAIDELLTTCAKAVLEGKPVAQPDGHQQVQLGGTRVVPKKVDHAAYVDLDVANGPSRGPAGARVTFVMFLDIANPFGVAVVAPLSEVLAQYPNDVRVVIKPVAYLPAHQLANEAIYAAHSQGALWPMLEQIAAHPDHLELEDLVGYARVLKLDVVRFRNDLTQHAFLDELELDRDQATSVDIRALPSAIVNGKRVHGALSTQSYVMAVEEALANR